MPSLLSESDTSTADSDPEQGVNTHVLHKLRRWKLSLSSLKLREEAGGERRVSSRCNTCKKSSEMHVSKVTADDGLPTDCPGSQVR
jgi:hypothetical protein